MAGRKDVQLLENQVAVISSLIPDMAFHFSRSHTVQIMIRLIPPILLKQNGTLQTVLTVPYKVLMSVEIPKISRPSGMLSNVVRAHASASCRVSLFSSASLWPTFVQRSRYRYFWFPTLAEGRQSNLDLQGNFGMQNLAIRIDIKSRENSRNMIQGCEWTMATAANGDR
ncbi:hypothetical protein RvY_08706 [Ramazzottius varieornatus]|uniref:Uncharacterized protein n=1 Tax=Ramazzottius varieornatus TaxID=947166 RepID=A0A1D1V6U1_RAMVA|nr:hypothetical protein RvY_08706 [Ramazzottius varieornatus]